VWAFIEVIEQRQDAAECTRVRVLLRHSVTGEEKSEPLKFAYPPIPSQIAAHAAKAANILNAQ